MKSLDFQAKVGIGLVISSGVFLILSDLIGQDKTIFIFQWGFLTAVISYCVSWIYDAFENQEYRTKIRRRTLRKIDKRIEAMNYLRAENHYGFWALDTRTGKTRAEFAPPKAPKTVTYNGAAENALEGPRPNALALLRNVSCGLVCGGRGAGKTELVRHIAAERAAGGWRVLLVDPKPAQPGKWIGCRVVGSDNDYGVIAAELESLSGTMGQNRRQTLVIIDEMTRLTLRIPEFSELWLPILLEGREYGLDCWIIGQSKTAQSIGLAGKYDLLECFDGIAFAKRDGAERWVEFESEGTPKPIQADHPGPLPIGNGTPPGDLAADPTDETMDAEWTEAGGAGADPDDRPAGRVVSGLLAYFKRPEGGTNQVDAILGTLHGIGRPMTPAEIADAAELDKAYTRQALRRLLKAGKVASPRRGRYEIRL